MALRRVQLGEHDRVVDMLFRRMWSGFEVHANPHNQKNYSLGGLYPDIVLLGMRDKSKGMIIEVETANGLTKAESKQWKRYSQLADQFYLMVPKPSLERAKKLCKEAKVKVSFAVYFPGFFGGIRFKFDV